MRVEDALHWPLNFVAFLECMKKQIFDRLFVKNRNIMENSTSLHYVWQFFKENSSFLKS